jgi:hypothetical protein
MPRWLTAAEARYERGSLLITTNQVVTRWGAVFGDDVLAAAILDRAASQPHADDSGRELSVQTKTKAGLLERTPPSGG